MKVLLVLALGLLLGSCCSESCDCNDHCKKPYVFDFVIGPGEYNEEDIDTLEIHYKFEGDRYFDTTRLFLNTGKYQPAHPCAGNAQLVLDKNLPDANGKLLRVDVYKVFTAVDSFRIDEMDLIITKSGDKCCRCVNTVRREFQLDGVSIIQTSLTPVPVSIGRKK